jgi:hypothetical protein
VGVTTAIENAPRRKAAPSEMLLTANRHPSNYKGVAAPTIFFQCRKQHQEIHAPTVHSAASRLVTPGKPYQQHQP